jgi:hypothetical protein
VPFKITADTSHPKNLDFAPTQILFRSTQFFGLKSDTAQKSIGATTLEKLLLQNVLIQLNNMYST